jgi:hypothetical protein
MKKPTPEGIRNGLDFEQAIADPDLPDIVTSTQMMIQLRRFNGTAQQALSNRAAAAAGKQKAGAGAGARIGGTGTGGGGKSGMSQDLGRVIGTPTSDTAEVDTSVMGESILGACGGGGGVVCRRADLSQKPFAARPKSPCKHPRVLIAAQPAPPNRHHECRRREARRAAAAGADRVWDGAVLFGVGIRAQGQLGRPAGWCFAEVDSRLRLTGFRGAVEPVEGAPVACEVAYMVCFPHSIADGCKRIQSWSLAGGSHFSQSRPWSASYAAAWTALSD